MGALARLTHGLRKSETAGQRIPASLTTSTGLDVCPPEGVKLLNLPATGYRGSVYDERAGDA